MLIEFNVGGTHFATYRSTLERYPDSLLCVALNNPNSQKDALGRFFFDRDPALFSRLLNMMRSPELNQVIDYRLATEAEYYCLPFEQNAFVIDTGQGDYYFSQEEYARFVEEIQVDKVGPRGHLFFPCNNQHLDAWKDLDNVAIEDYIFWLPHCPKICNKELTLSIKGIAFPKAILSSIEIKDLQWLLKCYSDPRSLEKLSQRWAISRQEGFYPYCYFSRSFIERTLEIRY